MSDDREPPEGTLLVAVAGRAHGVRGELRLNPESGDPSRLLDITRAWLVREGQPAREMTVASARLHGDVALVRFDGVDSPEAASLLTRSQVWALRDELPARGADEFGVGDVLGAKLFDGDRLVGEIVGVSSGGERDFLEVEVGGERVLVPTVKDWLIEMDLPGRRIVMRLPPGLVGD